MKMQYPGFASDWDDANLFSLLRSPFLLPSIFLHIIFMVFALRAVKLSLEKPSEEAPITVQLEDSRGTETKSIGPARGPGGRREIPKLGASVAPRAQTGKLETGAAEVPAPKADPDPEPASATPPKPVALPGPKVLAANNGGNPIDARESSPDSLVRLPTKAAPAALPGAATANPGTAQTSVAGLPSDARASGGINEGAQVPGSLRGTGKGTAPLGVPGGSKSGSGLTGAGSGSGIGGGGTTGLTGASNLDFNRYLQQLERRVKAMWKYPEEVSGVQEVAVRFSLDRAGKLIQAQVLESSDIRLNTSAIDAMKRASPFPPIPENLARELANEPLIVRFKVSIRVRG
jgi:TonB family protein